MNNFEEKSEDWYEIISKADADPLSGKQAGATVRAIRNAVLTLSSLTEKINKLERTINSAGNFLDRAISQSAVDIKFSLDNLNNNIVNLDEKISNFSRETTNLSETANRLIWWYIFFTAVIAVATVISIFY